MLQSRQQIKILFLITFSVSLKPNKSRPFRLKPESIILDIYSQTNKERSFLKIPVLQLDYTFIHVEDRTLLLEDRLEDKENIFTILKKKFNLFIVDGKYMHGIIFA